MNESKIEPYWQLGSEANYDQLHDVQVLIWARGICISGHNQEGNLIEAHGYEFDEVYDLSSIKNIILNEPLLADPEPVSKVWIAITRNMFVPEVWSDRQSIDEWFKKLYFVEHDETLSTAHSKEYGIDVYFPKKHLLKEMMHQFFPNRKSKFLIPPKSLMRYYSAESQNRAFVIFLEHTCSITFFEKDKLVFNRIIEMENVEDVVVEIADYWQIKNEDLANVELIVSGVASQLDLWTLQLNQYFNKVNFNKDFTTERFLKELSLCV